MKTVLLLSGGLDSPIAAYLLARKGYDIIAISFLTGFDPELKNRAKVIKIAKKLNTLTNNPKKLYILQHNDTIKLFIENGLRKLTCIMCKRYMLKVARLIALKENADFISNGDILGEQASQTLDNLIQIQKAVNDIPVIRPLIGFEKAEVIHISQKIGLYELSSIRTPSCDNNPKYPETHAKEKDIILSETNIDYEKIAKEIIQKAEIISF
ncbi:MAG: 7-cyano-7-deazaguanine synthase [Promethearchaeota archaeon]